MKLTSTLTAPERARLAMVAIRPITASSIYRMPKRVRWTGWQEVPI